MPGWLSRVCGWFERNPVPCVAVCCLALLYLRP